jgi:hypothetical protein
MKLSEALQKIIALSSAALEYWETELPKRHPKYPFVFPGEPETPPPPEQKKLAKLFASLPDEMIYQIALIVDHAEATSESPTLPSTTKR